MPDARPEYGTPIDVAKLRTLSVGRIHRDRVREGREHPETGRPWKSTENEAGRVTEHNVKGDRVDAVAKVDTIRAVLDPTSGKVSNA